MYYTTAAAAAAVFAIEWHRVCAIGFDTAVSAARCMKAHYKI